LSIEAAASTADADSILTAEFVVGAEVLVSVLGAQA
jgi:hypothetical protein